MNDTACSSFAPFSETAVPNVPFVLVFASSSSSAPSPVAGAAEVAVVAPAQFLLVLLGYELPKFNLERGNLPAVTVTVMCTVVAAAA